MTLSYEKKVAAINETGVMGGVTMSLSKKAPTIDLAKHGYWRGYSLDRVERNDVK